MDPTYSREIPSCSAIDLAEIRQSSKISSWIWSIISGVVTVLGHPGQGASQVEKSPCLNWATKFLMVAYDGACSPNVSFTMAWISFGALPCRKKTWRQLASPCCWNSVHHLTCFLSASVTRKDLQFSTWTDLSFQQHYRFCLQHQEVGRAKDLSAPPYTLWVMLWFCCNSTLLWQSNFYLICHKTTTFRTFHDCGSICCYYQIF